MLTLRRAVSVPGCCLTCWSVPNIMTVLCLGYSFSPSSLAQAPSLGCFVCGVAEACKLRSKVRVNTPGSSHPWQVRIPVTLLGF